MTEHDNIDIFKKDVCNFIRNSFLVSIKQKSGYSQQFHSNYVHQMHNYLILVSRKIHKVFNVIKTDAKKPVTIKATSSDFIFEFKMKEDYSSVFEFTYLQKYSRDLGHDFLTKRMRDTYGYVYIIKSEYGYKVGQTKNISTRINHFGVKLPFKFHLYAFVKTKQHVKLETELHDLLKHKRINGEWFELTESDKLDLESYVKNKGLILEYSKDNG